jgi:uncharacterized protein YbjT (DUF2867 family)
MSSLAMQYLYLQILHRQEQHMIVVVGGTGNIGRHVVAGLVDRGQEVRVLSRDGERARALLGPAPEIVVGDLSDPDLVTKLLQGADGAFVTTPGSPDQPALENGVLDAAVAAGLHRIVRVSVIGADPAHHVRYARWQADIEQHTAGLDLPVTLLRPNWFAENFLGSAPTISSHGALYGSAGDGRVGFVDSRDTAAVAVVTLLEDGHDGREYVVTGPAALTFAEAAEQLGEGLGRPVAYVDLPDAQLEQALLDASLPPELAADVVAINRNAREGNLDTATSTVQDVTGRPSRSLAAWARDNASAFAPSS